MSKPAPFFTVNRPARQGNRDPMVADCFARVEALGFEIAGQIEFKKSNFHRRPHEYNFRRTLFTHPKGHLFMIEEWDGAPGGKFNLNQARHAYFSRTHRHDPDYHEGAHGFRISASPLMMPAALDLQEIGDDAGPAIGNPMEDWRFCSLLDFSSDLAERAFSQGRRQAHASALAEEVLETAVPGFGGGHARFSAEARQATLAMDKRDLDAYAAREAEIRDRFGHYATEVRNPGWDMSRAAYYAPLGTPGDAAGKDILRVIGFEPGQHFETLNGRQHNSGSQLRPIGQPHVTGLDSTGECVLIQQGGSFFVMPAEIFLERHAPCRPDGVRITDALSREARSWIDEKGNKVTAEVSEGRVSQTAALPDSKLVVTDFLGNSVRYSSDPETGRAKGRAVGGGLPTSWDPRGGGTWFHDNGQPSRKVLVHPNRDVQTVEYDQAGTAVRRMQGSASGLTDETLGPDGVWELTAKFNQDPDLPPRPMK